MRRSGGASMQENELERLVREAVAETFAQLELQVAGLLRERWP